MKRLFAMGVALALGLSAPAIAADAKLEAKAEAKAAAKKSPRVTVSGMLNLNNATAAQLDLLPGVGEKAAKEIISYRSKQPFQRVEDLVKVKGFGKKRFEKVKPFLSTSGSTTIKAVKKTKDAS